MRKHAYAAGMWLAIAGMVQAEAPAKPVKVPFELLRTKHMAVKVKINGKGPYRLIFDTGAPITLLSNKAAKESGVLPKNFRPPLFALFGAKGEFPIKSLEIGDAKVEKASVVVMDHPAIKVMSRMLGPIEGIVGFPFFARYRMTIDYQAKELTLVPTDYEPGNILESLTKMMLNRKPPEPLLLAPAAQFGFVVDKDDKDKSPGVVVHQVRKGSAAAKAGLQKNDRILTLDGRWTDSVVDCYRAAVAVNPGDVIPLVIQRNGKRRTLRVKPRLGL